MKILDTVGIDMSKLTFDTRIHSNQDYKEFENSKFYNSRIGDKKIIRHSQRKR